MCFGEVVPTSTRVEDDLEVGMKSGSKHKDIGIRETRRRRAWMIEGSMLGSVPGNTRAQT